MSVTPTRHAACYYAGMTFTDNPPKPVKPFTVLFKRFLRDNWNHGLSTDSIIDARESCSYRRDRLGMYVAILDVRTGHVHRADWNGVPVDESVTDADD